MICAVHIIVSVTVAITQYIPRKWCYDGKVHYIVGTQNECIVLYEVGSYNNFFSCNISSKGFLLSVCLFALVISFAVSFLVYFPVCGKRYRR
jgi:hypothetical protein